MEENLNRIPDVIGIIIAMMIALLYYRHHIKSVFENKNYFFMSCMAVITMSGLLFLLFKNFGY